jgi:hypothetical protein
VVAAIAYFQLFFDFGAGWFNEIEREVEGGGQRPLPGRAVFELIENLEGRLPDRGLLGLVTDLFFTDTLTRSIGLALLGLAVSVVAYVIRYQGFRFARRGDLLSTPESQGVAEPRDGLSAHQEHPERVRDSDPIRPPRELGNAFDRHGGTVQHGWRAADPALPLEEARTMQQLLTCRAADCEFAW